MEQLKSTKIDKVLFVILKKTIFKLGYVRLHKSHKTVFPQNEGMSHPNFRRKKKYFTCLQIYIFILKGAQ